METSKRRGRPRSNPAIVETDFGKTLREIRESRGMSVQQVASQLGKSDALVYKWERGAVPPPDNKLIAQLAAVLGAETDALFWSAGRLSPDIQFTFNKNPAMYARLIRVADSLGKNGINQVIERCQTHRRSEAA